MSDDEVMRSSAATPVSTHFSVARSSQKMWQSWLLVSHMSAHQRPSLYQSLLSGLSAVGGLFRPVNEPPG